MSCGHLLLSIVRSRTPRINLSCRTRWSHNTLLFESGRKLSTAPQNLEQLVSSKSDPVSGSQDVESFESMFKNSKFVRVFDPIGVKVQGEIIAVVGENLYVDFGCKFHSVVKRPEKEHDKYGIGDNVVLLLKDLEVTMHPLGSSRDISLLEAEAELCGLSE